MKMEVEMGIAVEIEMKAEMEIAVRKHRYFWSGGCSSPAGACF